MEPRGRRQSFEGRRRFLLLPVATWLLSRLAPADAGILPPSSGGALEALAALRPYLDTLLPGGDAPAATAVGVHAHLVAKAGAQARYRRMLHLGCRWLDRQARGRGAVGFAAASAAVREQTVVAAAGMRRGSLPRRFFELTRADAFDHYYAQPAVWDWLGYPGPPQPAGFMDHHRAPADPRA